VKKDKYILGISAFYHDSAAVLLKNDEIIAAAQEERFTRKKNDQSFPSNAISFCLNFAPVSLSDLDAVVFYEKPFIKFERLLETYYVFAPRGFKSYLSAIPVWIKEKLFLKKMILEELKKIQDFDLTKVNLLFSDHHLSHAASAFYPSPLKSSAILTIDGVGEWSTATISRGKGSAIKMLRSLNFPHSVGFLYSAFTYFLGFKVNSGEYKLMGLAPYGDPTSSSLEKYKKIIKTELVSIKDDGSLFLNLDCFTFTTGLKMIDTKKWEELFGFKVRNPEEELKQKHCDLALAIQQVTEEIIFKLAHTAKELTGEENLCLAGGVALNCVASGKLVESGLFKDVWIQPAASDAGGALGGALAAYYQHFGGTRGVKSSEDSMKGSYLGPEFSDLDIQTVISKTKATFKHYSDFDELCKVCAGYLASGKVVGWFQGRMEWGPRALGNRSILGDARNSSMQKKLNLKIKFREGFRPFAPAVLSEDSKNYFELKKASPYMLLVSNVIEQRRVKLPKNYHKMGISEKLYFVRSDLPAITHLDYSARLQTVHKNTNPKFWSLINAFKNKTGYGVIVNTSFNVRGEPIVCTPEEAYTCFVKTDMDYLVIGNYLFDKKTTTVYDKKYTLEEKIYSD